jgi:hypothetical protein
MNILERIWLGFGKGVLLLLACVVLLNGVQ